MSTVTLEPSISEVLDELLDDAKGPIKDVSALLTRLTEAVDQRTQAAPPSSLSIRPAQESVGEFAEDFHRLARYSTSLFSQSGELQDLILDHLATPYIESKWPIYCDTDDHALLLCGLRHEEDGPVFFFHDDQYGPYLACKYAFLASQGDMQYQAYLIDRSGGARDSSITPAADLAWDIISGEVEMPDSARGVRSLVVSCPPRLLLEPSAAEEQSLLLARKANISTECLRRVTTLMGTDYKDSRLLDLRLAHQERSVATEVFASVSLAEWVVVVEGLLDDGTVAWEFVFDGSSGSNFPLVQIARAGASFSYAPRELRAEVQHATLDWQSFTTVRVPSRIGKGRRPQDFPEQRGEN